MLDIPSPLPLPANEPVLSYAPGSPERSSLKAEVTKLAGECPDLPHVVGGKDLFDGSSVDVRMPHDHRSVIGRIRSGGASVTARAIQAALIAAPAWARTPFEERARIFMRAADLLAGPWRATLNAAT